MRRTLQDTKKGAYQFDWRDLAKILYALDAGDRGQLIYAMDPLPHAGIAYLLEQINAFDLSRFKLYDREFDGEILTELQDGLREAVIVLLKTDVLADAVRNIETDDLVDLIEDLDDNKQEAILEVLADTDIFAIESSLNYPKHSSGILIQRELVIAPEDWQVGYAFGHLCTTENLAKQFYCVTLVDGKMNPLAKFSLAV